MAPALAAPARAATSAARPEVPHMPRPDSQQMKQLAALPRVLAQYVKIRTRVAREAIAWFKAHGYATGPVPPEDQPLADVVRKLLDVGNKAERMMGARR